MEKNYLINYYQLSPEDSLTALHTSTQGLKSSDLSARYNLYGRNKLIAGQKDLLIFKLLRQFKDLMVIILLVSGALSVFFQDYRSAFIMFLIVVINAFIGFIQEYKAEKVMDSLKNLVEAKAKVIRDDKEQEIEQEELLPGDIVVLEEGDAVPADLRILEENELSTNDFALTGESNPSRKFKHAIKGDALLGDRHNLAFMGTTVATGNAKGVVVATGMQTEIGRIANLTQKSTLELSPLQKELNNMAKKLTAITLAIALILFVIALLVKFSLEQAFIFAIGVASAMVPEGLPAQVTIALSLAAGRLAKDKAIIKKLSAVETLGATHIICTDKTGTLTKNEMTVQKIVIGNHIFSTTGSGYCPEGQIIDDNGKALTADQLKQYQLFFEDGAFASNARVCSPDKEHADWYALGDPTEAALINLAKKAGLNPEKMDEQYPELLEHPFDSVRKRMSSIRKIEDKYLAFVKGSPQNLLQCCTKIWDGENTRPITDADIKAIEEKDNEFASQALRNLGYAYREVENYTHDLKIEDVEQGLTWLGLAAMIDPPRDDVKEAMEAALKANIRVIVITGDYALTAAAIAKKVGLHKGENAEISVVNGQDLQKYSDIDLLHQLIHSNLIFSRTSPEDKLRIVSLLKRAGEVVSVTGDGVNDAPALKKADIGVAMGKTGTEVAKDAAEIVLLDDSFATLVRAIKEGRVIFQNLKKTIVSNMCGNSAELFTILISLIFASFYNFPLAILAYQVLAIDLIGQMLPITFLTWDAAQPRIMTEAPRNLDEHVVNKNSLLDFAYSGLIMGALAYLNFYLLIWRAGLSPQNLDLSNPIYIRATTLTYVSIVFLQWTNILSRRAGGRESVFSSYAWSNKRLLLGYAISLFFVLILVYVPAASSILATGPLQITDWLFAIAASIVFLIIQEIHKLNRRRQLAAKPASN